MINGLIHLDPSLLAVLIGIAAYVVIVAAIPKDILFGSTHYTRKHLKELEFSRQTSTPDDEILQDDAVATDALAKVFYSLPLSKFIYPYIVSSGMSKNVGSLFVACLVVFMISLIALSKLSVPFLLNIVCSVVFAYLAGFLIIERNKKKRSRIFMAQFPDALDMVVRSVKAGFPLNTSLGMIAESMESPIREEFRKVTSEVQHGATLPDSLDKLSKRINLPDVHFFAVVLTLQQEVGGNLAETLANLSSLLRKRKMMRMKILALTSEGRATGLVLGSLPFFVGGVVNFMSPDFLTPLFATSTGHNVIIATISFVVIGMAIIRKMINVEF